MYVFIDVQRMWRSDVSECFYRRTGAGTVVVSKLFNCKKALHPTMQQQ